LHGVIDSYQYLIKTIYGEKIKLTAYIRSVTILSDLFENALKQ
jgi:hypothetical protein